MTLERIPDDVLLELISYLPTLDNYHVYFGAEGYLPVIPPTALGRTRTLRTLSQTSRTLRSRCLEMAWRSVELCSVNLTNSYYKTIGDAILTAVRVLKACPHLLPLIQTVSVVLTRYKSAEIIPAFAECLATLPNLTAIQVIHAQSKMTTAIKNGFQGIRLPSVRKVSLPSSAHEIIKSCPNLEEVICTDAIGSTIVGSLVKGKCNQLRIVKGMSSPVARLTKHFPNLTHIGCWYHHWDRVPFKSFPLLDTIEIVFMWPHGLEEIPECVDISIKNASKILKESKSQADKTVIVTWNDLKADPDESYMVKRVVRVL